MVVPEMDEFIASKGEGCSILVSAGGGCEGLYDMAVRQVQVQVERSKGV